MLIIDFLTDVRVSIPVQKQGERQCLDQMARNFNASDNPKIRVNKRSVRDTLLQTKFKGRIGQENRSSGIAYEGADLDLAFQSYRKMNSLSSIVLSS